MLRVRLPIHLQARQRGEGPRRGGARRGEVGATACFSVAARLMQQTQCAHGCIPAADTNTNLSCALPCSLPAALRHHPGRLPGERSRLHSQQVGSMARLWLTSSTRGAEDAIEPACMPACMPAAMPHQRQHLTFHLLPRPAYFHPPPTRRQCCAGLQSIANMAAAIQAGYIDIGIAGGIEFFTKGGFDQSVLLDCCISVHDSFICWVWWQAGFAGCSKVESMPEPPEMPEGHTRTAAQPTRAMLHHRNASRPAGLAGQRQPQD